MERAFKKFFGQCWFIYRRPEIAQLIFRQICEDTKTYLRRVVSCECELMTLYPEKKMMRRSQSSPNLFIIKRMCP